MIVSEANVQAALEYLAQDPHPVALAQKDLTDAENEAEYVYAVVYAEQAGSVRDKETACDRDERVRDARRCVSGCGLSLGRHKARIKAAEMLIEVWRSENANARAAERIR